MFLDLKMNILKCVTKKYFNFFIKTLAKRKNPPIFAGLLTESTHNIEIQIWL